MQLLLRCLFGQRAFPSMLPCDLAGCSGAQGRVSRFSQPQASGQGVALCRSRYCQASAGSKAHLELASLGQADQLAKATKGSMQDVLQALCFISQGSCLHEYRGRPRPNLLWSTGQVLLEVQLSWVSLPGAADRDTLGSDGQASYIQTITAVLGRPGEGRRTIRKAEDKPAAELDNLAKLYEAGSQGNTGSFRSHI